MDFARRQRENALRHGIREALGELNSIMTDSAIALEQVRFDRDEIRVERERRGRRGH